MARMKPILAELKQECEKRDAEFQRLQNRERELQNREKELQKEREKIDQRRRNSFKTYAEICADRSRYPTRDAALQAYVGYIGIHDEDSLWQEAMDSFQRAWDVLDKSATGEAEQQTQGAPEM